MNYFPFHIGDYASATRHLSWDEDAAYRRLLDVYYTTEKPIPTDLRAVYRLVMAQTDSQREATAVVLAEFFELTDAGYINKRADEEIDAMRSKQKKQRDKANARWHKQRAEPGNAPAMPRHKETDATASETNADAMPPTPTPTPTPTPRCIEANASHPEPGSVVHRFPPGFDAFWSAYPRKVGKDAAAKAFAKRRVDADLLAAMLAAVETQRHSDQWRRDGGQFIPHPATWLNEGRWQDEAPRVEAIDAVFGAAL